MQSAQFQLHADIEERHWWFVARREVFRRLIASLVPPGQGHLVVDVGCGTGANLGRLAADYECIGIDTSAEAIRLARERFPRVEFRQGFAPGDIGDALARASLVVLSDVLEHVPDDFELFSSILAATPPGTRFLVTVPANLALWSQHDESFGHYRRYDLARLERVWQGLPVRVELASYYNSRLYGVVKLVRWWNRRRGQASGAAGTDFSIPPRPLNRMLESVLASESRRLVGILEHSGAQPFRAGVSLVAVLQREPGPCPVRSKPADLTADYFDPQAHAGV